METSTRSAHDLDDDEDMESFLKTIKLHDRFSDGYYNRDEDVLLDEELDASSDDLSGWRKRERDYCSVLNSEAKAEALSMLDTVKSSCLDDLILKKSDESRLVGHDSALLSGSFYRHPPFGDPLSEDDILKSALSLLDDEQCKKFREVGLFDGFVVEGNISKDAEKLLEDSDADFTDRGLNLIQVPMPSKTTPEKYNYDSQNKLISIPKSEGFKDTCILSPPSSVLLEGALPKPETTQHITPEQSVVRENKKCCSSDTDISVNDCKSSNHGLKKKTRRKKGNANSGSSANAVAKKPKKLQIKKTDLVPDSHLQEFELSDEDKKDDAKNVDDVRQGIDRSGALSSVALVQEVALSDFGFTEDEEIGEKFTVVLNKKKSRMRRDACHPADVESEASKDKHGARGARCLPVSALSAESNPMPSSFRGSEGTLSKCSSCSSVGSSLRFVSAASTRSERPERQMHSDSLPRPSYSSSSTTTRTPTPNSYAFILGDSSSVSATAEVTKLSAKDDFEPHGSEVETERLLSPPQSEVDTGFSSASSLCTDEPHTNGLTLAELSGSSYFPSDRADSEVYQDQGFTSLKTVVEESTSSDKPPLPTSAIPPTSIEHHKVEMLEHGNGVACSSQLRAAKHRKSAIFFDTRKPHVPDSMAPMDIVFGFDSGDERAGFKTCAGAVLCKNVTDLKGVTFFAGSSDGTGSADDANDCLDIVGPRTSFSAAKDGESDIKSSKPESLDISVDNNNSDVSGNSDRQREERREEVCVCHRKSPQKDAHVNSSCLSSGNGDTGTVKISSPCGKFDLRAAQKFLGKAFDNALRQESGSTSLHF